MVLRAFINARVVARKSVLTLLLLLQMICSPLANAALVGTWVSTSYSSARRVPPSPVHPPEPLQLIPRPLARGIAARALRTVAVVKCMIFVRYSEMESFQLDGV